MRTRIIALCLVLWVGGLSVGTPLSVDAAESGLRETAEQRDQRMQWWRDARFGMFIHWGLYAIPAGQWQGKPISGIGEWIMNSANIPVEQYEQLAKQFNPVKYDAAEWVRTAKEAGIKYVVITSKHHDGFCLFDAKSTKYNVAQASPYAKDLLKPLAEECRKQGLKFCVYYSVMDWHHPAQARANDKQYNPTKIVDDRKQEYLDYMRAQLKELVDTCDPEVLWFDGEWPDWYQEEDGLAIYQYLRQLKPQLIVNNRVGKGRAGMEGLNKGDRQYVGDFGTPEQQIPATGLPGVDWESCMTMNDTWGFRSDDQNWKSAETLVRNLIDIASKGGNYLLNIGPTSEGLIPEPSVQRLKEVGQWMKVNGQSIYATSASPFKQLAWGRCTKQLHDGGATLYLHVFDWPANGQLVVPGLKNAVEQAYLLADASRQPLATEIVRDGLAVSVPKGAPDKICSVVVLRVKGNLEIDLPMVSQQADGGIALPAREAICHGQQIKFEAGRNRDSIGFWLDPSDWVEWQFQVRQPGKFTVTAEIAAQASGAFEVRVADRKLSAKAANTGDYGKFERVVLGELEIATAGKGSLSVKAVKAGWQPFNLRSLVLTPVVK